MVLFLDDAEFSGVLTAEHGLVVIKAIVLPVGAAAARLVNLANLRHQFLVRRTFLLRDKGQRQGEIVYIDEPLAAVLHLGEHDIGGDIVEAFVEDGAVAEHLDEPAALHLRRAVRAAAELVEHGERCP